MSLSASNCDTLIKAYDYFPDTVAFGLTMNKMNTRTVSQIVALASIKHGCTTISGR